MHAAVHTGADSDRSRLPDSDRDVIVARWEKKTGKAAVREATGQMSRRSRPGARRREPRRPPMLSASRLRVTLNRERRATHRRRGESGSRPGECGQPAFEESADPHTPLRGTTALRMIAEDAEARPSQALGERAFERRDVVAPLPMKPLLASRFRAKRPKCNQIEPAPDGHELGELQLSCERVAFGGGAFVEVLPHPPER